MQLRKRRQSLDPWRFPDPQILLKKKIQADDSKL